MTAASEGTVLVVGTSGGVGSVVLQLLRALVPHVRVIATASRPEAEGCVRSLGAHGTVNHRGDLRAQIRQHELLTEVAQMVASGAARSTMTTTLRPIAVEQLREARRLVESGHMIGKAVITNAA